MNSKETLGENFSLRAINFKTQGFKGKIYSCQLNTEKVLEMEKKEFVLNYNEICATYLPTKEQTLQPC